MFTSRIAILTLITNALLLGVATPADPPKEEKKVPPLADLIKVLKDGTRAEQEEAARTIRDHYEGKCLEAIPQMAASMGRELARPSDAPEPGLPVLEKLLEAAQRAGPRRFKQLIEMTADKNPEIRAGAFRLLFTGSDHYQKWMYESKEKSGLDLADLLKVAKVGVGDKYPLVRKEAVLALAAVCEADDTLTVPAAELLAHALEDREQIKDKEPYDTPAFSAAGALQHFQGKAKPAFEALLKAAESDEPLLARDSARALGRLAKSDDKMAAVALKLFRKQLSDPKQTERGYMNAMGGVSQLGKHAEHAVTDIAALLNLPKPSREFRAAVFTILLELGPTSVPAVPTLLARLDTTTNEKEQYSILCVIAAIGPAARDAAKAIKKWADKNPDMSGTVRTMMDEALDKIK